jgi:hypothetical protein
MANKQFVSTNENNFLKVNLKPEEFIRITKFISQNDLNFGTSPQLGFKVAAENESWPFRSFLAISSNNILMKVIDTNIPYLPKKSNYLKIEIANPNNEEFNIAMLYTIWPRSN